MRTHRSILNFASGLLFTAVTTLTALVTAPWLVTWLGDARFRGDDRLGAFRMLVDCCGYLTLLDFGLGAALSPLLAGALGRDDPVALRRTLAAGMRAYLRLTLLTLVVGVAMTPLVAWLASRELGAPPAFVRDLRWAWLVILISFLPLALAPLRTLAEARQRAYRVNLLMTVQCLLITAMSLLLARAGWGVTGQAWAYSLGILSFFAMLTASGLRRNVGLLGEAVATPADPGIRAALWGLGLPSLLVSISGRVGLLSDNLVAGGFLGPAMALSLYLTVRLAGLAQAQLQAIGMACWAGLAELHARGDLETFNRRLVELTTLVAVLGLAVLGPIAAYGRHFFGLWMRGAPVLYGGDAALVVASINALLLGLFSLWGWCFSGTGQVRRLAAPTAVATAVNLAASLLLTWQLGLVGPVLGTLVAGVGVSLWWLPIELRRAFGLAPGRLFVAVAKPLAWGVPYAAALWVLARAHRPWGWPGLAVEMSAAALAFLVVGAVAILGPDERALWRQRLAGLRQIWNPSRRARQGADAGAGEPAGLALGHEAE